MNITLEFTDYLIIVLYCVFVVGIGFALKKYMKSSAEFLTSGRSIPTWVTGLAFISANLGAMELVGMAASGAKYGMATTHFYWVGAIPAMVFLAIFMMPFYYGSKARSVPEYLKLRFDEKTRAFNSFSFAVMTVFGSGIAMNALAKLLNQLLGWDYNISLWVCSALVLMYVLKGGLTSAIYTEVLQFFMIVLGFAPVVWMGLESVGGYSAMTDLLKEYSISKGMSSDAMTSAWAPLLGDAAKSEMGVNWFAMVFGLGFVLSFGYWCTNFLVVQRAMAAKDMNGARNTPLVASVPKMIMPILVILPGMIAVALMSAKENKNNPEGYRIPPVAIAASKAESTQKLADAAKKFEEIKTQTPAQIVAAIDPILGKPLNPDYVAQLVAKQNSATPIPADKLPSAIHNCVSENDWDGVILSLVSKYCPSGLLGLALTALLASFMSGMAGNVTAFNTVWTYDIYQAYIAPNKSDDHYLWMGKAITVVGILLSIACAYFARNFNNAMDIMQLVFSFVNAPLFATFIMGMFCKRTTGHGAFWGLVCGTMTSAIFHGLSLPGEATVGVKGGYFAELFGMKAIHFQSEMAQNFNLAIYSFLVCLVLTIIFSLVTKRTKTDEELTGLVYSLTPKYKAEDLPIYMRPAVLGSILMGVCIALNIIFW